MEDRLLESILKIQQETAPCLSLDEMGFSKSLVEKIYNWALQMADYGELSSYIPELANVEAGRTAISVGDLNGNIITTGNGCQVKVSIQSVVKPFLYIYALEQGVPAKSISSIEATAIPFNTDQILLPELHKKRPGHPLNNAGAISSAGSIADFNDFLTFMRLLTGNPGLEIIKSVYDSEMETNSNNRAITYRLVSSGRFSNYREAEDALDNYTKACSLGITTGETVNACLVLAAGGKKDEKRIVKQDHVVRAINVMNSFGLYEHTGEISLLAAGTRALSCKSGVGGLIINIDPGRGAFCTYGPQLDKSGNSVFGKYALIPLNNIMSSPNLMRLSLEEILRSIRSNNK